MKILIADDHNLFLQGLQFVLQSHFPDAKIITAQSYTQVFEILQNEHNFSLIVTDLAMPGAESLQGIKKIHSLAADTPIAILSAVFEPQIVRKTIDIGVSAYITKASSNNDIISAINMVLEGGVYIPQELFDRKDKLFAPMTESAPATKHIKASEFSPRQIDVLKYLAAGYSNKQIAFALDISEGTVKFYVTAILKKLNVLNRTAAGLKAVRLGLISTKNKLQK